MGSGINPVRRFPAVSRHYSPTVARRLIRASDERIRVDPSAAARGVSHLAVVRSRQHSRADGNPPEPGADPDAPAVRTIESADSAIIVRLFDIRPQTLRAPSRTVVYKSLELVFPDVFFRGCVSNSVPTRRDTKNAIRRPGRRWNRRFFQSGSRFRRSSWCQRLRGGPAAPQGRRQDRRSG
jgi:hypothetical protein